MSEPESIEEILEQDKITSSNLISDKVDGRKNNGRKAGSSNKATKDAKEAKKQFVERVNKNVDALFNAQLDLAKGEKYLMVIKTIGKGAKAKRETSIVTDPDTIKRFLDEDLQDTETEYYFMTTKPANNMALDSLLNRSFGKATEKIEFEGGLFKEAQLTIKVVSSDNTNTESETTDGQGATE